MLKKDLERRTKILRLSSLENESLGSKDPFFSNKQQTSIFFLEVRRKTRQHERSVAKTTERIALFIAEQQVVQRETSGCVSTQYGNLCLLRNDKDHDRHRLINTETFSLQRNRKCRIGIHSVFLKFESTD